MKKLMMLAVAMGALICEGAFRWTASGILDESGNSPSAGSLAGCFVAEADDSGMFPTIDRESFISRLCAGENMSLYLSGWATVDTKRMLSSLVSEYEGIAGGSLTGFAVVFNSDAVETATMFFVTDTKQVSVKVGGITTISFGSQTGATWLSIGGGSGYTPGDMTFTIHFYPNEYGDFVEGALWEQTVTNGYTAVAPEVVAHEGWRFIGWSTPYGGFYAAGDDIYVTSDMTCVAEYEAETEQTYTVMFDLGAHGTRTGGGDLEQTVVYGNAVDDIPCVEAMTGWRFTGWDGDVTVEITSNITFTAQYEVLPTMTVNFYPNEYGGFTEESVYLCHQEGVLAGDSVTPPDVVANTGWRFIGWSTPYGGFYSAGETVHAEEPGTYVAEYEEIAPETYTVTFDLGAHGTRTGGGELTQAVTNGCTAIVPEVAATDGWRFTGWDGDVTAAITGDVTFTARYVDSSTYRVTFDLGEHGICTNGDELTQWIEMSHYANLPSVTAEDGWRFLGWSRHPGFISEDTVFIAQYAQLPPTQMVRTVAVVDWNGWTNTWSYVLTKAGAVLGNGRDVCVEFDKRWLDGDTAIRNSLLSIPAEVDGYAVVGISSFAFYGVRMDGTISIPDGCSSIGDYAFYGSFFRHMTIPPGLKSIGRYAFQAACGEIGLPSEIGSLQLGEYAGGGRHRWSVVDAVNVGCWEAGLPFLGDDYVPAVFVSGRNGYGLVGWMDVEEEELIDAPFRSAVPVTVSPMWLPVSDERLWEAEDNEDGTVKIVAVRFSPVGTLGMPSTLGGKVVTGIGYGVFDGCASLTNVTIPNSVMNIEDCAFANCGLTDVTFEGNAPTVDGDAFAEVAADCVAYVSHSSAGWGVEIPGTWQGMRIEYFDVEPVLPEGMSIIGGVTNFWLEVEQPVRGGGIDCVSGWRPMDDMFFVNVTADVGYGFTGWTGDVSGLYQPSETRLAMVMDRSRTLSADFTPIEYAISYQDVKGAANANPTNYNVESWIDFAPLADVEGWRFAGWEPSFIPTGSVGDVTVTARWTRSKVRVNAGGVVAECDYGDRVTFTAPEAWETNGMQVVTLGTAFTAPVVTNTFTVTVTNDISFSWDILATNWWLEVAQPEQGAIAGAETGWFADGEVVTLTAAPGDHYHLTGWTGDTEGCAETNGTLLVTMNRARTIGATFALDAVSIGEAVNAAALAWYTEGDADWTGEWTSAAADGEHAARSGRITDSAESILGVTLEGAGVLAFDWRASCEAKYDAVRLEVDGELIRSLSGETGWTNVTINLGLGDHDIRWVYRKGRSKSAGEDAVWLDSVSWTAADVPTLPEAIGDFAWETEGDISWKAMRSGYAYEGDSFAIAEGLGDYQMSILRTMVTGPGRLIFRWAVSCEEGYDWFDFMVDGENYEMTTGETGWQTVSIDLGEGEHVLEWVYWKDELDEDELVGANCAMLDHVQWFPAGDEPPAINDETLTEFFVWLKEHHQLSESQTVNDAVAMIGNQTRAAGKQMSLYDEFVAGTNPEDETDEFTATITITGNQIDVKPSHDLGDKRIYTTLGKKNLSDEEWAPVKKGDEGSYNFFKVAVEMPMP